MYIPIQGDIIYLTLDPRAGHEQMGRRPALVISREDFNRTTGVALVCPITNTDRSFPLHVRLEDCNTTGVVMCEQVKSLDMAARDIEYKDHIPDVLLYEALDIVKGFIEL